MIANYNLSCNVEQTERMKLCPFKTLQKIAWTRNGSGFAVSQLVTRFMAVFK